MTRKPALKRALLLLMFGAMSFGANKTPLTDGALRDKVMIKLGGDQEVKGGGLGIEVNDGAVTLTGKVETDRQKTKAEKLARKVSGVKSVQNQIQVVHK